MARHKYVLSFLLLGLAATQLYGQASAKLTDAEMEQFLTAGRLVSSKLIGQGVTKSSRATLSYQGRVHDAQIQAINSKLNDLYDADGKPIPWRDDFRHNIAAYKLDRLLKLNMIPPSVQRNMGKLPAAFTWWVDDVSMTESDREKKEIPPPDPDAWKKQRNLATTFDQLIYNVDRNTGNLIILKDWTLVLIDHTRAFAPNTRLMDRSDFDRCSRPLLDALRKLDADTLTGLLKPYLTKQQIDGMLFRRDLIVKHFDQLIAEKGEAAVLFQ
jgi:hypothetical protein